jgi:hypothetical protein
MTVSPLKVGLTLGLLLGLWHFCWAMLVLVGWAQALLDFVFWMHFLSPPFQVQAFSPERAAILIGVTFLAGFVGGWVAGRLWNIFHRPHRTAR